MNMINLLILPIVLPFFFAIILLFMKEYVWTQRVLTVIGLVSSLIASLILMWKVQTAGVQSITLGSWPAPFGITLVSDMVSVLLVINSIIITLFVVIYSFTAIGEERERFYYYPTVLFMLTGVNGAFTTGDIFNMFVFFEVLLIASYVLIALGGRKDNLKSHSNIYSSMSFHPPCLLLRSDYFILS